MASTYYISTTGSDTTGTGTSGNPWRQPSKFVTSSAIGDTCVVAAGSYTWDSRTVTGRTFTGPTIVSKAAGGTGLPSAIFDAGSTYANYQTATSMTFNNIAFKNFISTNASSPAQRAFYMSANSCSATFTNCAFSAFQLDGNFYGDGGMVGSFDNKTSIAVTFTNCVFYNFSKYSLSAAAIFCGIKSNTGSSTFTMTSCSFYVNNSAPLTYWLVGGSPITATIKNTIVQNKQGTSALISGALTKTFSYSCFNGFTDSLSGTGVITTDPLFVDPENANFELQPTSPCRDTGTAT